MRQRHTTPDALPTRIRRCRPAGRASPKTPGAIYQGRLKTRFRRP
ncbi:hypothetical protein [Neisseria sp. WF04]|nr:hypothetical protein [Neisseria sp. WF04]